MAPPADFTTPDPSAFAVNEKPRRAGLILARDPLRVFHHHLVAESYDEAKWKADLGAVRIVDEADEVSWGYSLLAFGDWAGQPGEALAVFYFLRAVLLRAPSA